MRTVLLVASPKLLVDGRALRNTHTHLQLQRPNSGVQLPVVALQLLLKRLNVQLLPKPGHEALIVGAVSVNAGVKLRQRNGGRRYLAGVRRSARQRDRGERGGGVPPISEHRWRRTRAPRPLHTSTSKRPIAAASGGTCG